MLAFSFKKQFNFMPWNEWPEAYRIYNQDILQDFEQKILI